MVRRIVFALLLLAPAAGAVQAKSNVRVCHFPGKGHALLLSVAPSAVPAHLAHGDVEAPPSVQSAADCLVPQPPPQPVATTATTDALGTASFVIPQTNVIARFRVTAPDGSPASGVTAQIIVIGKDYLASAFDEYQVLAPSMVEGTLEEATPGSALQLIVDLVMQTFSTTAAGVSLLQSPPTLPGFIRSHFSIDTGCYTEQELYDLVNRSCYVASSVPVGIGVGALVLLGQSAGVIGSAWAAFVINNGGSVIVPTPWCPALAQQAAAGLFANKILPATIRSYHPPLLPGMKFFPLYYEYAGSCGGSCCTSTCFLASSAATCTGHYLPDTPCAADPCRKGACCNTGGCTVVSPPQCEQAGGTYLGDGTSCSPSANAQAAQYTLTSSRDLGGASFVVPFPGGRIRTTITIPSNMIRGSGTTGDCGRGDVRVELRVCPVGSGCTGVTWYAGHQIAICHDFVETLTFEMNNPPTPCSSFVFNAITEKVSTAVVEVLPP